MDEFGENINFDDLFDWVRVRSRKYVLEMSMNEAYSGHHKTLKKLIMAAIKYSTRRFNPFGPVKNSSYTEVRLSQCSQNGVRSSIGKFVPRTTIEECDNLRYTEPSYAKFSAFTLVRSS